MDLMSIRRRVMLASRKKEEGLPDAYQEVEYIESTGTQYIDTGLVLTSGVEFSLEYQYTENASSGYNFVFGDNLRDGNNPNYGSIGFGVYVNNSFYAWTNGKSLINGGSGTEGGMSGLGTNINSGKCKARGYFQDNLLYVKMITENKIANRQNAVEGGYEYTAWSSNTYTPTYEHSLLIFATRRRTTEIYYAKPIKMYALNMSTNGNRIIDLVPCYRKSDGEIGMYDLARKRFYTNYGTGVFLKGNDVA